MSDSGTVVEKVVESFPFLNASDEEVGEQIKKHALMTRIPKGTYIFVEGDECRQLALILSGTVRVYKPSESGREITLYRLGKGESCILTASCIFARSTFPAVAVTEEDLEAALVPAHIFRDWINRFEVWRNYVFRLLSKRLAEVLSTLEEVAFRRMDMRIAEYLITLHGIHTNDISVTHHDIAMELGTSREVVSRILKHFEYEKIISLQRGYITIKDVDRLRNKVEQLKS